MKEGQLVLNHEGKPTGIYIDDNIIYWFKMKIYTIGMVSISS